MGLARQRQVTSRRSGAYPPEDRLQKHAMVFCSAPGITGLARQMRLKPLPQAARHHKPLLVHSNLQFGRLRQKSHPLAQLKCQRALILKSLYWL